MSTKVWDKIAAKLNAVKVSRETFNVWKHRGFVPANQHLPLLNAGMTLKEMNRVSRHSGKA